MPGNSRGHLDLHWLPAVQDVRAALTGLRRLAETEAEAGYQALNRLAGHNLDYLATLQLDRILASLRERSTPWPEVRLAMLGTSSVEHLLAPIRVAGARRKLAITTHVGDFGQRRQELMLAGSTLYAFKPQVVLLSLQAADVLPPLPLAATEAEVEAAITAAVDDIAGLWKLAIGNLGATVIQHNFLPIEAPLFGNFDALLPGSPRAVTDRLNRALAAKARQDGVLLLDLAGWADRHGLDQWFDRARWFHAKQGVAASAAAFDGDLVARMLAAVRGQSAKCLVLDLDNTLWGGVIGDDGLAGIVLGQGSAAGEAFVAFQRYVRRLAERGVVLAVCSKNDLAVAEEAFSHVDMVLKREDIAVFVANWQDKAGNLRSIAETLNVGVDSLVFFDDNPAERDIVRQNLPDVFVPEVPEDAADYIHCLSESGCFEAVSFTAEDQMRGRQYAANAARAQAASGTDIASFLRSLDMRLIAARFNAVDMPRIVQLTGKTNQFNLTTRRHNTAAMEAFAADANSVALSFRLLDRFGDNGLIAVLVAVPGASATLRIDTLLMSCRVLGRQVEEEILRALVAEARLLGVAAILGDYLPTARNGMVRDLYRRLGFSLVEERPDGGATWSLSVADYVAPETATTVAAQPLAEAGE
jgi:FkbH-like protein